MVEAFVATWITACGVVTLTNLGKYNEGELVVATWITACGVVTSLPFGATFLTGAGCGLLLAVL